MSATSEPVREEFLLPLRKVLAWLVSLDVGDGKLVCPEHRVEHTGKNCGAAVIACELARHDPKADRRRMFELARGQGRRMLANLVREGDSPCHTFRPGRHDPFNCSNSVIDGGAASDALAEIVRTFGAELDPGERESFAAASLLHARTYLRYAVLDKGIPAQRAWGLTGLAASYALERDPLLEAAALEAVGQLEGVQNEDGSFPYHPLHWGAQHTGATDVSAFYQSRVSGFVLFALERLGRDPTKALFATALRRGLDFLCALIGPDGIKCGQVEAKPWYWGAEYEVASHAFDVYALAHAGARFDVLRYRRAALASFRAWAAHLDGEGRPASHKAGPGREKSYQCPVFWAGHAAWIARALCDLEAAARRSQSPAPPPAGALDLTLARFPLASLARLEDPCVVAWIRGARPRGNLHHGSPRGAGLVRAYDRQAGREFVAAERLFAPLAGEWVGRAGWPRPRAGFAAHRHELRFALWLVRNHLRGRRYARALGAWPRVLWRGHLAYASNLVSSAFDTQAELEDLSDGARVRAALAWRDGTPVAGSALERNYRVDGEGLEIEERLIAAGAARGVRYRFPAGAEPLEVAPSWVRYRWRVR